MANNIHPTAIIGPNVVLGDNNYIGPYCIIGMPAEHKKYWPKADPCYRSGIDEREIGKVIIGDNNVITGHVTIDAGTEGITKIGSNCYLLKHSHVGHDAHIGDYVTISCGAKVGGHATVQESCNLGLNAVIHQQQNIQRGCMLGMGAVVTKSLKTEPYKIYVGNPAKLLGDNSKHPNYTEQYKELYNL